MASARLRNRATAGPTTRIDDLDVPAAEILALSPDVARIDVLVPATRPTHRIIQIADCHYFSREDYRMIWSAPSEEGYSEYVKDVEEQQKAQLRLLCWLVDQKGLSEVFQEGVWEEHLPHIEQELRWLRDWEKSRDDAASSVAQLRRQIDDAEARGNDSTALRTRKRDAEKYAGWGLNGGAIRRLLISRPSVRLLPAESKECFESHPRAGPDMELREAAIVENLLSRSTCAVIVLGAAHDLSKQVHRLGRGRCEYVRAIPVGFVNCVKRYDGDKESRVAF